MSELERVRERFILHWGEMGSLWGINRTMAQIHALLFISPEPLSANEIMDELQISRDILDHLDENNVAYALLSSPEKILSAVDVVYQTRIDRSRLSKKNISLKKYNIDADVLKQMRQDAIIMHPLPRSVEIDPAVDGDPRAAYFRQTANGLYVRMALLTMLFETDI